MWKACGKTSTFLLFLGSLFPKAETNGRCFLSNQNNAEVNYSPFGAGRGWGLFLEEIPCKANHGKDYKQKHKKHHSYKSGAWNVRTLNQGSHLESLTKEMQKNAVFVLGVSQVQWKGQSEIRNDDYVVDYSEGERAGRGLAIVVLKSILGSVVTKTVCNDRIIALKLKAERVTILLM
jgi:hypothetical protein